MFEHVLGFIWFVEVFGLFVVVVKTDKPNFPIPFVFYIFLHLMIFLLPLIFNKISKTYFPLLGAVVTLTLMWIFALKLYLSMYR